MHPALSIILFTTLSGAGLGLGAMIGFFGVPSGGDAFGSFPLLPSASAAIILAAGGLICSVFHLRRPSRAWRAFSQWRSSWLSREGLLAPAALLALFVQAIAFIHYPGISWFAGIAAALLCLFAVYATSMIYAQIRAVPAWNTQLTSLLYLGFSAAGGVLTASVLLAGFSTLRANRVFGGALIDHSLQNTLWLSSAVLIFIAWGLQFLWWRRLDRTGTGTSTAETATRLEKFGSVRLLEPPHSGSNYLLDEMGYVVARRHAAKLRLIALLVGGAMPLALLTLLQIQGFGPIAAAVFGLVALILHLIGVGISRWLFFAEAKHTVTLYY